MRPSHKVAILLVCLGIAVAGYRFTTRSRASAPVASTALASAIPVAPPQGGKASPQTGNLISRAGWAYYNIDGAVGSKEDLAPSSADLPAGAEVIRVHVDQAGPQIFDVGMSYHFNDVAFEQGEQVILRFKARAKNQNLIAPQMQRDFAPTYPACWTKFIKLTPEWKQYEFSFTTAAYAPKDAALVFKLGQSTGVIDLADITLVRAGGAAKK